MGHSKNSLRIEAHCDTCGSGVALDPRAPGSRVERIGGVVSFIAICPEIKGGSHEVTIERIDAFDVPSGQSAVAYLIEAGADNKIDDIPLAV